MTRFCWAIAMVLAAGVAGCQDMGFKGAPAPGDQPYESASGAPAPAAPVDPATESSAGDHAAPITAAAWPFAPVAVRIHPFTTFEPAASENASAAETTAVALDARLELLDPQGDVTKGVGDWRLELYEAGTRASQVGQERRLYVWNVPMRTMDANRRHYDSITRTYSIKLKLDEPPPAGRRLELRVQFEDPAGRRFNAKAPLQYQGRK